MGKFVEWLLAQGPITGLTMSPFSFSHFTSQTPPTLLGLMTLTFVVWHIESLGKFFHLVSYLYIHLGGGSNEVVSPFSGTYWTFHMNYWSQRLEALSMTHADNDKVLVINLVFMVPSRGSLWAHFIFPLILASHRNALHLTNTLHIAFHKNKLLQNKMHHIILHWHFRDFTSLHFSFV